MIEYCDRTVVKSDYHQFTIGPSSLRELNFSEYPEFNLGVFTGETVVVYAGCRVGPVNVELEVHDTQPPDNAMDWEDVAEGDMHYDSPEGAALWHWSLDQALPQDSDRKLTPGGAHRYRVRICARGRALEYDGPVLGEPVEDYLVQLWPTSSPSPAHQSKNESGV